MNKMGNLDILLSGLIEYSEAILEIAKEMKRMFLEEPTTLPEKPETTLSFTDLQAKLAEKSREGFTAEIKAILISRGAENFLPFSHRTMKLF